MSGLECVVCGRPMWRLGFDSRECVAYCMAHDPRREYVLRNVLIAPVYLQMADPVADTETP